MKRIKVSIQHHYKLSEGGYFHFPLLVLSFGSNGFALYVLGISLSIFTKAKSPSGDLGV